MICYARITSVSEGQGDKNHPCIPAFHSRACKVAIVPRECNRRKSKAFLSCDAGKTAARARYDDDVRGRGADICTHIRTRLCANNMRDSTRLANSDRLCSLLVAVVHAAAKKATWPRGFDRGQLSPFSPSPSILFRASVEFFFIELGTHRLRMRRKWNVSEGVLFVVRDWGRTFRIILPPAAHRREKVSILIVLSRRERILLEPEINVWRNLHRQVIINYLNSTFWLMTIIYYQPDTNLDGSLYLLLNFVSYISFSYLFLGFNSAWGFEHE